MSSLTYRRNSPRWPAEPRRAGWNWGLFAALAYTALVWWAAFKIFAWVTS